VKAGKAAAVSATASAAAAAGKGPPGVKAAKEDKKAAKEKLFNRVSLHSEHQSMHSNAHIVPRGEKASTVPPLPSHQNFRVPVAAAQPESSISHGAETGRGYPVCMKFEPSEGEGPSTSIVGGVGLCLRSSAQQLQRG
jgi:hypothetical protein